MLPQSGFVQYPVTCPRSAVWKSYPHGPVLALAAAGQVFAGGEFTGLGGVSRNGLAFADFTGKVTDWNPDVGAGRVVYALVVDGYVVYAGGAFETVSGQARANLAAFGAAGELLPWNPSPNGSITAIAHGGGVVYVGGGVGFTTIGGQPRANLAAIDGAGTATPWNPGADGHVNALAVRGETVWVGGAFGTIQGQARRNLAAVDAAGNVTSWTPSRPMAWCTAWRSTEGRSTSAASLEASAPTHAAGSPRSTRGATLTPWKWPWGFRVLRCTWAARSRRSLTSPARRSRPFDASGAHPWNPGRLRSGAGARPRANGRGLADPDRRAVHAHRRAPALDFPRIPPKLRESGAAPRRG